VGDRHTRYRREEGNYQHARGASRVRRETLDDESAVRARLHRAADRAHLDVAVRQEPHSASALEDERVPDDPVVFGTGPHERRHRGVDPDAVWTAETTRG